MLLHPFCLSKVIKKLHNLLNFAISRGKPTYFFPVTCIPPLLRCYDVRHYVTNRYPFFGHNTWYLTRNSTVYDEYHTTQCGEDNVIRSLGGKVEMLH